MKAVEVGIEKTLAVSSVIKPFAFQEKKLRVLVISAAFPPLRGGESDQVFHLSKHLAEQGLDVQLLTVRGSEASEQLPFRVYPIMRDWSWSDLPRLVNFLRQCSPQAVLLKYSAWIYNDHPMITFAPTITKFVLPGCRFVTQFPIPDGSLPEKKSALARAIRKASATISGKANVDYHLGTLLRDSHRIIVFSENHAADLAKRLSAAKQKMLLIPPPPAMHMVTQDEGRSRKIGREMLGLRDDDFVIAYFGVLYRGKGLETLLWAFKKAAGKRKDAKLVLIGGQANVLDGYSYFQEICELSKKLGIERSILAREYEWDSFDGSLYLHAADACVLPFDQGVTLNRSSFGSAVAHGLPIITTRGSTLESPFVDRSNVLLCRPKDPESMAAAIESVICDVELRQRLSQGALQMARDWFSWDKAIEQTVHALQAKVNDPSVHLKSNACHEIQ
jgi:glycosyltransferase involved in cell wall biosynthesis